jgi:hypothetical protein
MPGDHQRWVVTQRIEVVGSGGDRLQHSEPADLCRHADAVSDRDWLYRSVLPQQRRLQTSIVLDIDDSDDMAHGQQELAAFNTRAGGHCFQPIHIFEAGSGEPALVGAAGRLHDLVGTSAAGLAIRLCRLLHGFG